MDFGVDVGVVKGYEEYRKLEANTKFMDILEKYNYLKSRFEKAFNVEFEDDTKTFRTFEAITIMLSEIELIIKEG